VHFVDQWLHVIPPLAVYALVGLIIGLESMGVPLPGEVTLISAALLSAQHVQTKWGVISPWGVAIGAVSGAILGDSLGYLIGRRGGRPLLAWLGRKFPTHFGPDHLARAEEAFTKWGMWAVFVGRFIALLRILAGPLAGALRMSYGKFLVANASGGVLWAGGTTLVIYIVGVAAQKWLSNFSLIALGVAVVFGLATTVFLRRKTSRKKDEVVSTK
jgi:membrane protein DedA with SNARE-associated domain